MATHCVHGLLDAAERQENKITLVLDHQKNICPQETECLYHFSVRNMTDYLSKMLFLRTDVKNSLHMFLETKMIYSNSFPLDKNTAKPTDNRQESLKQTNKQKKATFKWCKGFVLVYSYFYLQETNRLKSELRSA